MLKIAILGSTKGTSMSPIIDAIENQDLDMEIGVIVSNKKNAVILEKARQKKIPWIYLSSSEQTKEDYDIKLINLLNSLDIDLVLLIGYLRILTPVFINKWKDKILNVHPSLLPEFAGMMNLDVHRSVLERGVKYTGCSIHLVTDDVDGGKVLIQKKCRVSEYDSVQSLKYKVQSLEGIALIEALQLCLNNDGKFEHVVSEKNKDIVDILPIKRALISVSDKEGLVPMVVELQKGGVEIFSTGGTAKVLRDAGLEVFDVSEYTKFPEIMEGRVKTLHPKIYGGILGKRDKHADIAQEHDILWFDLIICNLYPFLDMVRSAKSEEEIIENIDIGGPSMIRSSAKNFKWVSVVTSKSDYVSLLEEIKISSGVCLITRKKLAKKAFGYTARYDSYIYNYFLRESDDDIPEYLHFSFRKDYDLLYGENPHQLAGVYRDEMNTRQSILNAKIWQGKKLSFNNIGDADSALKTLAEFSQPACVVMKHANPCGVAIGDDIKNVFSRAYNADSVSAFGGIIALNRTCTADIAFDIINVFSEIVIAPSYEPEALEIFAKKKKMRVLEVGEILPLARLLDFRLVAGGGVLQEYDIKELLRDDLSFVSDKNPTEIEILDLMFAWKVLKHVKSNAILIAKKQATVGVGAGQMSRVDAVNIAIRKAESSTEGAVLASDAFFPFRDSIDKIAQTGIRAIIQPGGSIRDKEVIDACNEYGIAMVFTGYRCFLH